MTIFNQINNVSDDYTYIINKSDVFYDFNTLSGNSDSITTYYYMNDEWTEVSITEQAYDEIIETVSNNREIKPILLDTDDDFLSLDYSEVMYHGIFSNQTNFPNDIPQNTYIALIKAPSQTVFGHSGGLSQGLVIVDENSSSTSNDYPEYILIIIKSLLLSSQTRIFTPEEYEPRAKEYLSALETNEILNDIVTMLRQEIADISQQSSLGVVTLSVDTSDLLDGGHDTSGLGLFYYFESINQPNITNPNVIYKIRLNYDEPIGPLGDYYGGNVITRYYMYVNDGEGRQFVSLGVDENDIAEMINEKVGNIEEDMTL